MDEQTVHTQKKKRRRLAGWIKMLIAVAATLVLSTGAWCLLLGSDGLALVQTLSLIHI